MSNSDYFSKIATVYDSVFDSIDVIFSLESCLQYQILPLELDDGHLVVGMIDPRDREAIKFISNALQPFDYTFHAQAIDIQTHQMVLASYLKRTPNEGSSDNEGAKIVRSTSSTLVEESGSELGAESLANLSINKSVGEYSSSSNYDSATLIDIPEGSNLSEIVDGFANQVNIDQSFPEISSNRGSINVYSNDSATLVDIPQEPEAVSEKLESFRNAGNTVNNFDSATLVDIPQEPEAVSEKLESFRNAGNTVNNFDSATLVDIHQQPNSSNPKSRKSIDSKQTIVIDNFANPEPLQVFETNPEIRDSSNQNSEINLDGYNQGQASVLEQNNLKHGVLDASNPKVLWQQLLERIVSGDVDKLYFQQKSDYGSILSSKGGSVSPLLDNVELAVFRETINVIKVMARLPLKKLEKHKKIAIPKLYKHERVLLRVEFFPSRLGEEITMQVFQGEALKFYEQRQADKTIEQAISFGLKLEKALGKILTYKGSVEMSDLDSLSNIVGQIDQKLQSFRNSQS